MKWLNMHFQVFFSLPTYSAMFTMTSFESVMNLLNIGFQSFLCPFNLLRIVHNENLWIYYEVAKYAFQVFFVSSTESTMFTTKTVEYIMKWLFFVQSTYSTLITMTRFESVVNLVNMQFQVFFSLSTDSTMSAMKTFEYNMMWLNMRF